MNHSPLSIEKNTGCLAVTPKQAEQLTEQHLSNPISAWLTSPELAKLAGVSRQSISKAIKSGQWRGCELKTRTISTATGKTLQVHAESLPLKLRRDWYLQWGVDVTAAMEAPGSVPAEMTSVGLIDEKQVPLAKFKESVILPIVAHPPYSKERAAAMAKVGDTMLEFPNGKRKKVSKATLHNWIKRYENKLSGLVKKQRKDKGGSRVVIGREWDRYFQDKLDAEELAHIHDAITRYIRSEWRSGQRGWRAVCEHSSTKLIEIMRISDNPSTQQALQALSSDTLMTLCQIGRRRVEPERHYSLVAISEQDAKSFDDKYQPRIRRAYDDVTPMSIVVGDVHPIDVKLLREDGSEVYARAIAWHDVGTNRIWYTLIQLSKGEGVRREHVAASFASMCEAWGLPHLLYLDNGSEYNWAEMINAFTEISKLHNHAMKISGADPKTDPQVSAFVIETRQCVLRSQPYNAAGKPKIEGAFSVLEQGFMALLTGWVGGDRMRKKTQNMGKEPVAYPGTWEEFHADIDALLESYHKRSQQGALKGKCPNEVYNTYIRSGWGTVTVNQDALNLAFSYQASRVADRGYISYALPGQESVRYYHDELLPYTGRRLNIRIAMHQPEHCFVFDEDEHVLCVARPDKAYHPLDREGAKERGRRRKAMTRMISERRKHCDRLDLVSETKRHNQYGPDALEAPSTAHVDIAQLNQMLRKVDEINRERIAQQAEQTKPTEMQQWATGNNALLAAVDWEDEDDDNA